MTSSFEGQKFVLGTTVMTRGADAEVPYVEMYEALARHATGDWGEVCDEDKKSNDRALRTRDRLLSAYTTKNGVKFWIITEWDRSVTTVLLPDEY